MRKSSLFFILSIAMLFSCSNKVEKSVQQQQQKGTAMTEGEKFATLSESRVSELLAKAKSVGDVVVDPAAILSQDEIDKILARVAETRVDQIADDEIALLETNMGTIAIAFYSEIAPEHSKGFKRLVTAGYYNGTRFHRIVDNFMIQGGDILTRDANPDNDGTGGPGYNLAAEFNSIPHDLGILSMARAQDPNSAGSQFFICLSREGTRALDGQYTVFGKVIGGLDVVKAIGKVRTRPNRFGENSSPIKPVYIKNAYMVTR